MSPIQLEEEKKEPITIFKTILCKYIRDRGHIIFSMVDVTRQDKLKIALLGLWRRHKSSETGYEKFNHVLEEILSSPKLLQELRKLGIIEVHMNVDEPYILVEVSRLKEVCRNY